MRHGTSGRNARKRSRPVSLENLSGYDTEDLRRFFVKGLRALHVRGPVSIVVVAAPKRSRGCATVRGGKLVIAIASPANFRLRRLARLLEHEAAHLIGFEHEEMEDRLRYSLGGVPSWAKGTVIRYRGRAPRQLPRLRGEMKGLT